MIPTLKNFQPPETATAYNPAKTISVPASGSAELTLKGRGSDVFGVNRILPYAKDMLGVTVRATLNNERIIFDDISLAVLRELFKNTELLAPYIIHQNNDLTFTLTNTTGAAVDVNIEALGYDGNSTRKLLTEYKESGLAMPQPVFLYAKQDLTANQTNQAVSVPTKAADLLLTRSAIRTGADDDINVSLELINETIKNNVFVQQFNDEYAHGRSAVPIQIGANVPFSLRASNANVGNQTLSFLGEAYLKPKEG